MGRQDLAHFNRIKLCSQKYQRFTIFRPTKLCIKFFQVMSSQEVIKHSRKIIGAVNTKNLSLKHKLGEIFIEILIIVFAISLSLFLERWREKSHDREIEKNFLTALKGDLQADLKEMNAASVRSISMKEGAKYFLKPDQQISWSPDSIKLYASKLFHDVYFFPNANRYESLKSSGKLDVIENETLQNDIINLYQTLIPDLEGQIKYFDDFMNIQVKDYLIHSLKMDAENKPLFDRSFLSSSEIKNLLLLYSDLDDVLKRLNNAINAGEKIIAEIEQDQK